MMELRQQVRDFLNSGNLSDSEFAKMAGYSPAAFSQWMSGKYKGDAAKVEAAVRDVLSRLLRKKRSPRREIGFVETSISRKVFEVADMCHTYGELGVVVGASGLGKTWGAREYAQRNSGVILIEVDETCTSKIPFTRTLCEALGLDSTGGLAGMLDNVKKRLKNSGRLLLVDEAENLPYKTLELIRRLHDLCQIGVVLIGMPQLKANLRGRRRDFAQLYSRVGVPATLKGLHITDAEALVKQVMPQANGLVKVFYKHCDNSMRILKKMVVRATYVSGLNSEKVDAETIEAIRSTMIDKED